MAKVKWQPKEWISPDWVKFSLLQMPLKFPANYFTHTNITSHDIWWSPPLLPLKIIKCGKILGSPHSLLWEIGACLGWTEELCVHSPGPGSRLNGWLSSANSDFVAGAKPQAGIRDTWGDPAKLQGSICCSSLIWSHGLRGGIHNKKFPNWLKMELLLCSHWFLKTELNKSSCTQWPWAVTNQS